MRMGKTGQTRKPDLGMHCKVAARPTGLESVAVVKGFDIASRSSGPRGDILGNLLHGFAFENSLKNLVAIRIESRLNIEMQQGRRRIDGISRHPKCGKVQNDVEYQNDRGRKE